MPKLNNHIIKDVFEELLLKQQHFEPQYNNFLKVKPLVFAGKENLAVFIQLLRKVKSATLYSSSISMDLQNRSLSSDSFPIGLWKEMALYIPKLTINIFDEAYQMGMIKAIEHSIRLEKVEALDDISPEAWRSLLNTSVKEISAPLRSLIDIQAFEEGLYANIESVEALYHIDDAVLLKEFLLNLHIPCKSLKIQNIESLFTLSQIILDNMERVMSPIVEVLEIRLNVTEDIQMADLNLTRLFEALQFAFPALKELKMKLKIDEGGEDAMGNNFVPHLGFLQTVVNALTDQIQRANIQYKLSFQYCRTEYVDWENNNVLEMRNAFTSMKFIKEKEFEISEQWVLTNQLSQYKDLKITFYIDEIEVNSELYAEMMDDLDIGDFYNYDDNDYGEVDDDDYGEVDDDDYGEVDADALYDDAGFDDY